MRHLRGLAVAGSILLALGAPQFAAAQSKISDQTKRNLEEAMRGEAFESALYRQYAEWADLSGFPEAAKAFRAVAESEGKVHFVREAAAYGLIRSTPENLQAAMKDELDEQIKFNAKFAGEAKAAGDEKVAAMFAKIASEEQEHYDILKKALESLKSEPAGSLADPAAK